MGWTIARKDGGTIPEGQALIDDGGKATFGRHETDDDTVYVITYTDTTCTASTEYTVKGCGGGGDDPKSDCCVTPLDNIGQVCNTSKTAAQYFIDAGFACDGTHWWSGPLDGPDDAGFPATGWTDAGDSIRCSFDKLVLTPMDTWITATKSNNPHTQDGKEYSGYANYTIAANTDSKPRVGRVKVTLTSEENSRFEWDEHPAGTPFCMGKSEGGACEGDKEMYVYIYQQGNGSTPPTPTTCDCTTFSTVGLGSDALPADASLATSYYVGNYTAATNCTDSITVTGVKEGTDFLGTFSFSNGKIYATPKSQNISGCDREVQYNTKQGDCTDYFTVKQLGNKCAITNFQVDPTVMRDGVELGGTVAYHLNICDSECEETIEFTFHNNGRVTTIHHYPPFASSYISGSFWVESTVWAVGDAYFQVDVKGETKTYTFQVKP